MRPLQILERALSQSRVGLADFYSNNAPGCREKDGQQLRTQPRRLLLN